MFVRRIAVLILTTLCLFFTLIPTTRAAVVTEIQSSTEILNASSHNSWSLISFVQVDELPDFYHDGFLDLSTYSDSGWNSFDAENNWAISSGNRIEDNFSIEYDFAGNLNVTAGTTDLSAPISKSFTGFVLHINDVVGPGSTTGLQDLTLTTQIFGESPVIYNLGDFLADSATDGSKSYYFNFQNTYGFNEYFRLSGKFVSNSDGYYQGLSFESVAIPEEENEIIQAGDIAFVAYNSNIIGDSYNEPFAWVALANIPANQEIYFTDASAGYLNNPTLLGREATAGWVSSEVLPAGTVVRWLADHWSIGSYIGNPFGSATPGLNNNGDNLFAYINLPSPAGSYFDLSATTMLAGITFGNSGWLESGTASSTYSYVPTGTAGIPISQGTNTAVYIDEKENGYYDGPSSPATKEQWLARINNPSNWVTADAETSADDGFDLRLWPTTLDVVDASSPALSGFLTFPIPGYEPYNNGIISSVFDHSSSGLNHRMEVEYLKDNVVTAYTGESANSTYGVDPEFTKGYRQEDGSDFSLDGNYFYSGKSDGVYLYYDGHPGVDFAVPTGTQVLAAAEGTVIEADYLNDLGNYIKIEHPNGYYTIYGHLSSISVNEGQGVEAGDLIALSGSSGAAAGAHLHFQVRFGNSTGRYSVDPYGFMGQDVLWNIYSNSDTVPPQIIDFEINDTSIEEGDSIEINFTVSDSGGAGLDFFQIWWTSDNEGLPNNNGWSQFGSNISIVDAESGPAGFTADVKPPLGKYWFGIHVDDRAGNYSTESDGGFTPVLVEISEAGSLPKINRVDPSTPPLVNSRQPFSIYGENFQQGCSVDLYDLRTGESFLNRTYNYKGSDELELSVNFTAIEASWEVQVSNPDGKKSGRFSFEVKNPDPPPVSGTVDIRPTLVKTNGYVFEPGENILVSWKIINDGSSEAQPSDSQLRVTQSPVSYGTHVDNVGLPTRTTVIEGGGSITQNKSISAPNTPGTYFIWVIADNQDELDQSNSSNDFVSSSGITVEVEEPTNFSLKFPLENRTPHNATINSIFDHDESWGVIEAYTGEIGVKDSADDQLTPDDPSYRHRDNQSTFLINEHYSGAGYPAYLSYDNHRGYDYRTTEADQVSVDGIPGHINVLAAAAGTVVKVNLEVTDPAGIYVRIEHESHGFQTQYLHLHESLVEEGGTVARGEVIGIAGDTGTPGSPHLHFEVKKKINGSWIPVDPYGWNLAPEEDPYPYPNEYLWEIPKVVSQVQTGTLAGSQTFLTVNTGAAEPLSYQWRKDNVDLDGENENHFYIPQSEEDDSGRYDVILTYGDGSSDQVGVDLTIRDNPDRNFNGLNDAWELVHFGALGMRKAGLDDDGDGLSNREESLLNTSPTNPASGLFNRIEIRNGLPVITINEMKKRGTYILLFAEDLSSGQWNEISRWQSPDDIQNFEFIDEHQGAKGFYKLVFEESWKDEDSDGLNDGWEFQYFDDLDHNSRSTDFDGDGLTDLQECLLGTDPRDEQSGIIPRVFQSESGESLIEISEMKPVGIYILERATQSSPDEWVEVNRWSFPEMALNTTILDSGAPSEPCIYRVKFSEN